MAQNKRTDERGGRAFKGSQLQAQICVNVSHRVDELNQAIYKALPDLKDYHLRWVSPRESKGYLEYRDDDFLKAVELLSCK